MPADKDTNAFDEDADFEDARPPGDDTDDDVAGDDGKPRGFASAPMWARVWLVIGVAILIYILFGGFLGLRGGHHNAAPPPPNATATTQAPPDPLANRPKVNPIVSDVVGKDPGVRQKIADVVDRALKQGADQCSLYWGLAGSGWSIEYQRPGGPALPNFTWNVPLFVDTHCFPTVTSPLIPFTAIPPVVTTVPSGSGSALSNGQHQPLSPTGSQ